MDTGGGSGDVCARAQSDIDRDGYIPRAIGLRPKGQRSKGRAAPKIGKDEPTATMQISWVDPWPASKVTEDPFLWCLSCERRGF